MVKLFFRLGDRRFQAGEIVYHAGLREFAAVCGATSRSVELQQPNGATYAADVVMLRQSDDVGRAKAYADSLRAIDPGIRRWFIETWAGGATVDECAARLRVAVQEAGPLRLPPSMETEPPAMETETSDGQ